MAPAANIDHFYHCLHNLGAMVPHHCSGNNQNTQLWKYELHKPLTRKQHLAVAFVLEQKLIKPESSTAKCLDSN